MCKPVYCPACGEFTLHKGTCENPEPIFHGQRCRYDPRSNEIDFAGSWNFSNVLHFIENHYSLVEYRLYERPFPRLAVYGRSRQQIDRVISHGLAVITPDDIIVWDRVVRGPIGLEHFCGFDLTHDAARPFLEAVPSRVCEPPYAPK